MSFSGHFPQVLGDDAESDFNLLARNLGYTVVRRRNLSPGIDLIANHTGIAGDHGTLVRPLFSPAGPTAFSIKRGEFDNSDVSVLVDYVTEARRSNDTTLNSIVGGVLVAGALLSEPRINEIAGRGVHCWDIRRLIFYASKAKVVSESLHMGAVTERALRQLQGTLVIRPEKMKKAVMYVKAYLFVDDHNLMLQRDHTATMLQDVYNLGLMPIIEAMHCDVQAGLSLHSVGPVQSQLVVDAYQDFSGDQQRHPHAFFGAATSLEIQSYAAAPWTAIFRV